MTFDSMEDVEIFYKAYAHNVGFSVRIGQKKSIDDVVVWRRFPCSKEGFRTKGGGTQEGFEGREDKNTCKKDYQTWL